MSDRTAEPELVVKKEPELQEDVSSLSPETQQVDADPLELLLPVKFEPDTDECSVKLEIDIEPTVFYNPLSFPAPHESTKVWTTEREQLKEIQIATKPEMDAQSAREYCEKIKKEIELHQKNIDHLQSTSSNTRERMREYRKRRKMKKQLIYKFEREQLKEIPEKPEMDAQSAREYCEKIKKQITDHLQRVYEPVKEDVPQPANTVSCGDDNNFITEDKSYSCNNCQYKSSKKRNLVKHMHVHTAVKPYSCSNCQYKSSLKSVLVRHMYTHTGEKRYSCSNCHYKCSRKEDLVRHMYTHTGEKPYSCSNCQYKCIEKYRLIKHMCIHTGEKPYSCSNCQYKCLSKQQLVLHTRTHTGEKPYGCSNCQYRSYQKSDIVRHMLRYCKTRP